MRNDPRWTMAQFFGKCAKCGVKTFKGTAVFYYPKSRRNYCGPCGQDKEREFAAAAFDEDMYHC